MSDPTAQADKYKQMTDMIQTTTKGKKITGFAKKLTYGIIILITLVGVVGSFTVIPLDMDAFVKFIPVLAWLVVPLVISIGANSAVSTIKSKDVEKQKVVVDGVNEKPPTDGAVG